MKVNFAISPRRVGWVLFLIATYLAVQSLAAEYVQVEMVSSEAGGVIPELIDLLSVNAEGTIPTWYSSMVILLAAGVLGVISLVRQRQRDRDRRYWWGLTAIFVYLSVDEGAAIHEIFSEPLRETFQTSGYLEFAWLLLFVPLTLLFGLLYSRFWWRLPAQTRTLFAGSGVLYVAGAVFVEAVSANRWSVDGGISFSYLAIATVEEWLEMAGMSLFVFALLHYLQGLEGGVAIGRGSSSDPLVGTAGPRPERLRRRWLAVVAGVVIVLNGAMFGWAIVQDERPAALVDVPFYRAMAADFEGRGVVILGIEGSLEADNPAAAQQAESLLTLFDDVLVVNLPESRLAIAFAAADLPFDAAELEARLQASGEVGYEILNRQTLLELVGE